MAEKLAQKLGSETFLGRHSREEVERESATIIKTCILLIKFVTVTDTNNLIVNIKVTKIKTIVKMNLKTTWRPIHFGF